MGHRNYRLLRWLGSFGTLGSLFLGNPQQLSRLGAQTFKFCIVRTLPFHRLERLSIPLAGLISLIELPMRRSQDETSERELVFGH
jgi:hypothetical protein